MLSAVAPVWDGNETWLVVTGVIMWGAFPVVYAMVLSAFYLPVLVMLLGLILRGVAFEFRGKAHSSRWVWDVSFVGGSFAASFMQGVMVGALVEGLQFSNGDYTGGTFGWLTAFSALCGIGLCLGYSLLGACWLVRKCEGRRSGCRTAPDPAAGDRRAGLPGRRLCLCACRTSSDSASLDRPALSVRVSGDRRRCGRRCWPRASCAMTTIGRSIWSR